jgi:undecaprenyl-diphosphatase
MPSARFSELTVALPRLAVLAFTILAVCVMVITRHLVVRALGWLIAGLAITATAFSRVELGVHWTTDVIAGAVFTAVWLTAIAAVLGGRLRNGCG